MLLKINNNNNINKNIKIRTCMMSCIIEKINNKNSIGMFF